ncbi:MAG TPA: efflux transporter outer membrane subunit [Myxococcaceae bacterium]|nr:efflux transporter outer membrane subunit [Myxococcaceae bacterium]
MTTAKQETRGALPASVIAEILAVGVLLALSACAVGPKFTKPETKPSETWSTKSDPQISTESAVNPAWWQVFSDPALNRLVELAYQQNLPLQVAGLRIVEARAQLGIATGSQYPQLQVVFGQAEAVGLSNNTANSPLTLAGSLPPGTSLSFNRNYFNYQIGFDAVWELDFWGKYRRGVEAETASLLATVGDYYYSLVTLTAEVARTYVVIRTFEVLVELAQENIRNQEQGLQIAQSRFRHGATSELDVTQATTLLESTRSTVPQLQIGLEQARNALSTLLGQPTGTVEALLAGPKEIPKAPAKVVVGVPIEMLRRRPDIRSAELTAAAQCARIGVAKAELYPSLTLFGSFGVQASDKGASANPFSADALYYTVGPRISWPFFNYGRIENGVRVQDARFEQLLVNYRNAVLKAAQEVEDAMIGFLNDERAVAFQQGAVKAAQRSVEIALVQYREGAVDYQRVLDAQRSLLQEQNSLAQTSSGVATNLVALYKALGGGWELRQGQQFIPEQMQNEMKDRTNWGDMLSQPRDPETTKPASAAKD